MDKNTEARETWAREQVRDLYYLRSSAEIPPARWVVEYFAGYDLEAGGEGVWRPAATGHNRLRAAVAILICLLARPERDHRLRWIPANRFPFTF